MVACAGARAQTYAVDGWPSAELLFSLSVETLDDRIARDGPIKELDAVGWAIRLAKRLEALHSLGVAHGSVSPACILTAGADRTSRACIADVQVTTTSIPFQSPERVLGGDLSPADDTWAVACTLYTALTGTSPFVGANDAETKQKILGGQPAPLAVYDVGDDDLQHILDSALARELAQRTSTVTALRGALEEWHPDPGVSALSPLDDDDDASEGEEDMRTVMRAAPAFLLDLPRKAAPAPVAAPVPDDDDDEDQATRMREFQVPAHLIGASPFGKGPPTPPASSHGAPAAHGPGPRPAAGRPIDNIPPGFSAPAAYGGPAPAPAASPFGAPGLRVGAKATLLGAGGPSAFGIGGTAPMAPFGAAAPRNDDDDDDEDEDEDENGRTLMRISPVDETSHPSGLRMAHPPAAGAAAPDDDDDGARTMMRDANDPIWGAPEGRVPPPPAPGAPMPFGGAPLGAAPGWSNDPAPARTMALNAFDFPAELTPHPAPGSGSFPRVQDHGPPSGVSFGLNAGHPANARQPGAPPTMGFPAVGTPLPALAVAPFQAGPQPGPMAPIGALMGPAGPTVAQLEAAASAANSRRIVVLTAAIALLMIAATTFVVLLLRGIK